MHRAGGGRGTANQLSLNSPISRTANKKELGRRYSRSLPLRTTDRRSPDHPRHLSILGPRQGRGYIPDAQRGELERNARREDCQRHGAFPSQMRLCGFLGHECLLWKRSPFDKNTEAESPDNHCRVLLWDGPADTPIVFENALHQRLFRDRHDIPNDFSPLNSITSSAREWLIVIAALNVGTPLKRYFGSRPAHLLVGRLFRRFCSFACRVRIFLYPASRHRRARQQRLPEPFQIGVGFAGAVGHSLNMGG